MAIRDGVRSEVIPPVAPGMRRQIRARVVAPNKPGSYSLQLSLVQEAVAWFDSWNSETAARCTIEVRERHGRGQTVPSGPFDYAAQSSVFNPSAAATLQQQYWEQTLQTPRYADKKRLLRHGAKAYSQNDEDGILAEIFRRIGAASNTFLEIGVGPGLENNTLALLLSGWRGMWVEANRADVAAARSRFLSYIDRGFLQIEECFVTRSNVDALLATAGLTDEPDLLSIDVDGNDYWIWQAVQYIRPRVVMIEYNAAWFPPMSLTIVYQERFRWDGSNYFGASLKALEALGERKGYHLVGCNFSGINAFFVRADLCEDKFLAPYSAENHYEPPRYWMSYQAGHPAGVGPVEIIP